MRSDDAKLAALASPGLWPATAPRGLCPIFPQWPFGDIWGRGILINMHLVLPLNVMWAVVHLPAFMSPKSA